MERAAYPIGTPERFNGQTYLEAERMMDDMVRLAKVSRGDTPARPRAHGLSGRDTRWG